MSNATRWVVRLLLALLAAMALVGWLKREELARLWAVQTLFRPDRIVANFSTMNDAFLWRPVSRGDGPVSALPRGAPLVLPPGTVEWMTDRAVTSLIVVQDGHIILEDYRLGTGAEDLRISWSMAKSFLSALMGLLVEDGTIDSLDDPVILYAPELAGSAYDDASIRNVLQMSSGVAFNEDYLDYNSDINRMGRVLALGGSMDGFASGLTAQAGPPGETWRYVSIDTHVLGMVIRGATGRDIPDLLADRIIAPLGLEAEPYYLTDGEGVAFVLGGLNMRSRDYARFGLMVERNGRVNGHQIVPQDWIRTSTRASAPTAAGEMGYGFQWWIPRDARPGEFLARGVYGQYIYIDQTHQVVIVVTAADLGFTQAGRHHENVEMLRRIARASRS